MIFGIAAVLILLMIFSGVAVPLALWAAPFLWHIWGLEVQERLQRMRFTF